MGTVANLAVRISANAEEFEKGLKGVQDSTTNTLGALGKIGVSLAGIFSVHEIIQAVEAIGDWGGKIVDFSNRLGISADAVQRFKFAAEQGGSSIQTIGRAIEFANRGLASGDTGFVGALGKVGLSLKDIQGLTPDQMFLRLATAIDGTTNAAIKDEAAQKLMGKAGQELQQILPDLIANFNAAPTAMEGAAEAADMLGDSWDRLKAKGEAIAGNLAFIISIASQGSVFSDLIEGLDKATDEMVNAKRASQDLGPRPRMAAVGAEGPRLGDIELLSDANSKLDDRLKNVNETTRQHAERMKAAAAAHRAAEKEAAAYRETMNFVGLEMMKADKASMDYFANLGKGIMAMRESNNPQLLLQSTSLPIEGLMNLPGQVQDNIVQVQQIVPVWDGVMQNLRDSASSAFTDMLFGVTSFKDGFVSIWHSLKSSLMDIVNDIIHNVLGRLINGFTSLLTGGSFGGGFGGGLGGMLGGLLGLGGKAGGAAGAAGAAGAGGAGGGLGGLFTNPWTAVIGGAAALGLSIWKGGLFRGGEEALQVNPARDSFFRDFQDRFGGDQQSALASAFAERGIAGDVADRMIQRLYEADTMKEFEAATAAINKTLEEGAAKSTEGNALLGAASTQATQAVNSLTTALGGLTQAATDAATGSLVMREPVGGYDEAAGGDGLWYISPEKRQELEDAASQYVGVNPDDMNGGGVTNVVNLAGMVYGSPQELEDAVGRAYNNSIERGGSNFQKARALQAQLAT